MASSREYIEYISSASINANTIELTVRWAKLQMDRQLFTFIHIVDIHNNTVYMLYCKFVSSSYLKSSSAIDLYVIK